jgi:hypothetical protein
MSYTKTIFVHRGLAPDLEFLLFSFLLGARNGCSSPPGTTKAFVFSYSWASVSFTRLCRAQLYKNASRHNLLLCQRWFFFKSIHHTIHNYQHQLPTQQNKTKLKRTLNLVVTTASLATQLRTIEYLVLQKTQPTTPCHQWASSHTNILGKLHAFF